MLYIMSDLHGQYDKFINMLKLIKFKDTDQLYILGDVVDRGDEAIKILQYIIQKPNIELLLGNHEEMMLMSLLESSVGHYQCWMSNGGLSTLNDFDNLSTTKQKEILNYLKNCKLYKIINRYILVHAGVDCSLPSNLINEFMELQDKDMLLWAKEEFIYQPALKDYTVIFGHTPTGFMQGIRPMKIWHGENKIGIDCGACFNGGRLGCLRLDDMKEFYC